MSLTPKHAILAYPLQILTSNASPNRPISGFRVYGLGGMSEEVHCVGVRCAKVVEGFQNKIPDAGRQPHVPHPFWRVGSQSDG